MSAEAAVNQSENIKRELSGIKSTLADLIDASPKSQGVVDFAGSVAANAAVLACTLGASAALPGLGAAVKSTFAAGVSACKRQLDSLTPLESLMTKFKAVLQEERQKRERAVSAGRGREGTISEKAYDIVGHFILIENPQIEDLERLRGDLAITRRNSGSIRDKIMLAATNVIRKLKELQHLTEGGKRTRTMRRKNRRSKTVKSQRRR